MGSLDDRDLSSIERARRRGSSPEPGQEPSEPSESATENDADVIELESKLIDVDRDPAPPLPKMITLPRDVALAALRDVQDFSVIRALWGRRLQARPFRK